MQSSPPHKCQCFLVTQVNTLVDFLRFPLIWARLGLSILWTIVTKGPQDFKISSKEPCSQQNIAIYFNSFVWYDWHGYHADSTSGITSGVTRRSTKNVYHLFKRTYIYIYIQKDLNVEERLTKWQMSSKIEAIIYVLVKPQLWKLIFFPRLAPWLAIWRSFEVEAWKCWHRGGCHLPHGSKAEGGRHFCAKSDGSWLSQLKPVLQVATKFSRPVKWIGVPQLLYITWAMRYRIPCLSRKSWLRTSLCCLLVGAQGLDFLLLASADIMIIFRHFAAKRVFWMRCVLIDTLTERAMIKSAVAACRRSQKTFECVKAVRCWHSFARVLLNGMTHGCYKRWAVQRLVYAQISQTCNCNSHASYF